MIEPNQYVNGCSSSKVRERDPLQVRPSGWGLLPVYRFQITCDTVSRQCRKCRGELPIFTFQGDFDWHYIEGLDFAVQDTDTATFWISPCSPSSAARLELTYNRVLASSSSALTATCRLPDFSTTGTVRMATILNGTVGTRVRYPSVGACHVREGVEL